MDRMAHWINEKLKRSMAVLQMLKRKSANLFLSPLKVIRITKIKISEQVTNLRSLTKRTKARLRYGSPNPKSEVVLVKEKVENSFKVERPEMKTEILETKTITSNSNWDEVRCEHCNQLIKGKYATRHHVEGNTLPIRKLQR